MERCPICRGRISAEQRCGRCKADLSELLQISCEAETLTQQAIGALSCHDYQKAKQQLQRALSLKSDPLVTQLLGFCESMLD